MYSVLPVIVIYLVLLGIMGFALFWVVRLGVRFGLRDHQRWLNLTGGGPGRL
jgi:hypothetical protein